MNAGLLRVWGIWDFIYQHVTRLEYVDKKNENIFRVVFCKYRGPDLMTEDGHIIRHGDPIVKLHIYNWKLAKMLSGINNDARLAIKTLKIVKESLPPLAIYINNHTKGDYIKGIVGTTLLHRGVTKLGFDVHEVPNFWWFKVKNQYLKLMLTLMHPNGKQRLKEKPEELIVKRVYMSKELFYEKYLP